MKTKNKYSIVLILGIIGTLVLLYKYNLSKNNISYISNKIDESKIEEKIEKSELNILFTGDIMTDRYIRKQINKYENNSELKIGKNFVSKYLNNLSEVNNKYDYVVANLEGPITENKSKSLNDDGSYGKDLIFTFPTSTIQILKLLNIKVVSLANNHTDNFYYKGYEDTKKFLTSSNIEYFGNPYNNNFVDKDEKLSETICEKDICIAYIGYNQFTTKNEEKIINEEIKRIKNKNLELEKNKIIDFIIIMPHWGVEYEKLSTKTEREYARKWVDSGADLVVGAHPHVVQESEIYKDKNIYYSLGNYIFDQWFSVEVQNGKALDITFKKECENKIDFCKKEIKINKELKVFIDRNGVRYVL